MALAMLLLSSCGTMPPARDALEPGADPPRYSLVFVVHGDGNYLYHDADGSERRADQEAVARARAIAARNPSAEVFIFHQIERRHVLFLFPRRDGRAWYYRHGSLVAEKSYWRDQGESRFDPEVRIYEQLAGAQSPRTVRLFFYFGHELPEFGGEGYDASYAKRPVTVEDLADGIGAMTGDSTRFDLLALATCFGGTPRTIGALAPHARYIVASPDNLHLSYFDLEPLAGLDVAAGDSATAAFADRFARHAFATLSDQVQTAVSVVVYDAQAVGNFVDAVAAPYDSTLSAAAATPRISVARCDCADDPAFARPGMSDGLTVLYRAPRFGRMKSQQHHSGWECWRINE